MDGMDVCQKCGKLRSYRELDFQSNQCLNQTECLRYLREKRLNKQVIASEWQAIEKRGALRKRTSRR